MATRSKARRERRKVSAKRRVQEHRSGGGSNHLKFPEGVGIFQPKAGRYRLDFMSFKVGKGNPFADKDDTYFERTYWVHRNVGPNDDWHLCLAKTFKKPCPICEYRAKLTRDPDADEEEVKALGPKERQLWLVRDLAHPDEGVMIWDVSYYLFGELLDKKIRNADEDDGYEFFADSEEGLTVRLALEQSDRGKWLEVTDIEFRARKKGYDPESVDENTCLDDILVGLPYDRLKSIFMQVEEEDEVEDEDEVEETKPARKSSRRKPVEEEVDDEDDDEVEEKPKVKPQTKSKPKSKPAPVEEEEDDWDDDEEEEKKPEPSKSKPKAKPASKPKKEKGDDDWDDWDDDD